MLYIVNSDTGQIVESYDGYHITSEKLQELADYFDCPLYVISGQHAGMTAVPDPVVQDTLWPEVPPSAEPERDWKFLDELGQKRAI